MEVCVDQRAANDHDDVRLAEGVEGLQPEVTPVLVPEELPEDRRNDLANMAGYLVAPRPRDLRGLLVEDARELAVDPSDPPVQGAVQLQQLDPVHHARRVAGGRLPLHLLPTSHEPVAGARIPTGLHEG